MKAVADDGPGDHRSHRAAQALKAARRDQHGDAVAGQAQHRAHQVHRQPDLEHDPAPEAIGQRPEQKLAHRQPQEEAAETALHRRLAHPEIRAQLGQGGQVHVDGQRGCRRQQAEQEDEAQVACLFGVGHVGSYSAGRAYVARISKGEQVIRQPRAASVGPAGDAMG